jgi:hypothetical protein
MKNITSFKMSQKNGDKSLWAICDCMGHTIIQVWSLNDPLEEMKLVLN